MYSCILKNSVNSCIFLKNEIGNFESLILILLILNKISKFFGDIQFLLFAHRMLHWENSLSTAPELAGMAKTSGINFWINSCNSIPTVNCRHIHALNVIIVLFCVYFKNSCILSCIVYNSLLAPQTYRCGISFLIVLWVWLSPLLIEWYKNHVSAAVIVVVFFPPQLRVDEYLSSRNNMALVLNKTVYEGVLNDVTCGAGAFCEYDDYNWDWSLNHLSLSCLRGNSRINRPLLVLLPTLPRVLHIGQW